jgi:rhamnosyltransferase subunit B
LHVILASLGTDGDVFPFLGLGARLLARGHRVTLASSEPYRGLAEEQGLRFCPLLSTAEHEEAFAHPDVWHPLKGAAFLARWGGRFLGPHYGLLSEEAKDGRAVIASSVGVLAARLVQEKHRHPAATVILQPWLVQSNMLPPVMPAGLTLPAWAPWPVGSLYWRLVDGVGDVLIGPELNRLRRTLGLSPVRRVFRWWLSPELVIGLCPDWYGPPQPDWPPQLRLTGFPRFDGRVCSPLPADLLSFCKRDTAPIAFTFGTGMRHGDHLFEAAAQAIAALGMRALFLTRHADQLPHPLPESIRHVPFASFRELFPHCAAVVHHGGIGTTAQALAAGTPQLVLPIAYDQRDNAARVKRLGAGDWLGRSRRGPRSLVEALRRILTQETGRRCHEIADRFGADEPLDEAATWIERLAERKL